MPGQPEKKAVRPVAGRIAAVVVVVAVALAGFWYATKDLPPNRVQFIEAQVIILSANEDGEIDGVCLTPDLTADVERDNDLGGNCYRNQIPRGQFGIAADQADLVPGALVLAGVVSLVHPDGLGGYILLDARPLPEERVRQIRGGD